MKGLLIIPFPALHASVSPERYLALSVPTAIADDLPLLAVAANEELHQVKIAVKPRSAFSGGIMALLTASDFVTAGSDHVAHAIVV